MDHKEIQRKIKNNIALKDVTWNEAGIPTLTQQALTKKQQAHKQASSSYSDEFILDLDSEPTNENGHKLDCTCKKCSKVPRMTEVRALSSMKADPVKNPLNKKPS